MKHIVTGLKYHKFPNVMCKNIVFRKYTIIRLIYARYANCEHLSRRNDKYTSIISISCLMIVYANPHKNIRNEYRKTELRKTDLLKWKLTSLHTRWRKSCIYPVNIFILYYIILHYIILYLHYIILYTYISHVEIFQASQ